MEHGRDEIVTRLTEEGLDVTEWTDAPGTVYPEHTHPYDEVRVVLEGGMTVTVDGSPYELGPGDRIDLSAGEPHSAQVHERGCRYLAGTRRS